MDEEAKNRPGGPATEFRYMEVIDQETKEVVGVRDPSGKVHPLAENEELIGVKGESGERKPFIRTTVPFEEWAAKNSDTDTS